jgi:hypothetical protein
MEVLGVLATSTRPCCLLFSYPSFVTKVEKYTFHLTHPCSKDVFVSALAQLPKMVIDITPASPELRANSDKE